MQKRMSLQRSLLLQYSRDHTYPYSNLITFLDGTVMLCNGQNVSPTGHCLIFDPTNHGWADSPYGDMNRLRNGGRGIKVGQDQLLVMGGQSENLSI